MPQDAMTDVSPGVCAESAAKPSVVLTLEGTMRLIGMCCVDGTLQTAQEYRNLVCNCFSYAHQLGLSWQARDISAMAQSFWWMPEVAAETGALGEQIGNGHPCISDGGKFGLRSAAHLAECMDPSRGWGYFHSSSEDPVPFDDLPCAFSAPGFLDGGDRRLYC